MNFPGAVFYALFMILSKSEDLTKTGIVSCCRISITTGEIRDIIFLTKLCVIGSRIKIFHCSPTVPDFPIWSGRTQIKACFVKFSRNTINQRPSPAIYEIPIITVDFSS